MKWAIQIFGFVMALIGGAVLAHLIGPLGTFGAALISAGYILIHIGAE